MKAVTVSDLRKALANLHDDMPIGLSVYEHQWSPDHASSHGPIAVHQVLMHYAGGITKGAAIMHWHLIRLLACAVGSLFVGFGLVGFAIGMGLHAITMQACG